MKSNSDTIPVTLAYILPKMMRDHQQLQVISEADNERIGVLKHAAFSSVYKLICMEKIAVGSADLRRNIFTSVIRFIHSTLDGSR